ncbi:MAG: hypothetical protein J6B04_00340 [Clostridia bacterium]|nr:hypothetical protein [Clostridia bacterium]
MRKIYIIANLLAVACLATLFAACELKHEHAFTKWTDCGDSHESVCTCGEKQTGEHRWGEGVLSAHETEEGKMVKKVTCGDCLKSYAAEEYVATVDHSTWQMALDLREADFTLYEAREQDGVFYSKTYKGANGVFYHNVTSTKAELQGVVIEEEFYYEENGMRYRLRRVFENEAWTSRLTEVSQLRYDAMKTFVNLNSIFLRDSFAYDKNTGEYNLTQEYDIDSDFKMIEGKVKFVNGIVVSAQSTWQSKKSGTLYKIQRTVTYGDGQIDIPKE